MYQPVAASRSHGTLRARRRKRQIWSLLMADEPKPADDNLAEVLAKGLKNVGGIVFEAPTSSTSPKPKTASATFVREIGGLSQPLSLACTADGTLLVLDRPDAARFRVLRFDVAGKPNGVLCDFRKGTADAELM